VSPLAKSKKIGPGRIITVGGGKGGVGKSIVSANLSLAIGEMGRDVILVDGDLGAANLHTHFGLVRSGRGLASFVTHEVETLPELLLNTFAPRVQLLAGAGAVPGAANLGYGPKQRLIRHLRALKCDVLVIDVGAGSAFNVVDLFALGDLRLIVSTPQLTSLQNAYAFTKAAAWRTVHTLLKSQGRHKAPLDLSSSETETIGAFLSRVSLGEPEMALRCSMALQYFGGLILGNQLFTPQEGRALHALSRMLQDFLGIESPVLGMLRAKRSMHDSVGRRLPYLADAGGEQNAMIFRDAAERLLKIDVSEIREGRSQACEVDPAERDALLPSEVDDQMRGSIEDYMARSERIQVNWQATLVADGKTQEITLMDISEGGARALLERLPAQGSKQLLLLDQHEGRPCISVEICNISKELSECGLRFLDSPELGNKLLGKARAEAAASAPKESNEEKRALH